MSSERREAENDDRLPLASGPLVYLCVGVNNTVKTSCVACVCTHMAVYPYLIHLRLAMRVRPTAAACAALWCE